MFTKIIVEYMEAQATEIMHRLDLLMGRVSDLSANVSDLSGRVGRLESNQQHSILHTMKNKSFLFTVIATLFFAVLAYLGFTPDLDTATDLAARAAEIKAAITARNYMLAGSGIIALGAFIYDWVSGGKDDTGGR